MRQLMICFAAILVLTAFNSEPSYKLALLKYSGGGDWYANPTALPNLSRFCNQELDTNLDPNFETVEVGRPW